MDIAAALEIAKHHGPWAVAVWFLWRALQDSQANILKLAQESIAATKVSTERETLAFAEFVEMKHQLQHLTALLERDRE